MSNDIEHRAAFGLLPGCDLTAGGIKDIEVLTGTITWPAKRKPIDGHPLTQAWINESTKIDKPKHKVTFTIDANKATAESELFLRMAANRGEKFILDRLKKDYKPNVMNCPTCSMACDKTHDGYIPGSKYKYEYFHCYNCKKNFKISL